MTHNRSLLAMTENPELAVNLAGQFFLWGKGRMARSDQDLSSLVVCPDCDLLQQRVSLPKGARAYCVRCHALFFDLLRNSFISKYKGKQDTYN